AGRVENLNGGLALRFFLEKVVNQRSCRRILPIQQGIGTVFVFARVLESRSRRGSVEVYIPFSNLVTILPQGRNIVENPERTPMRCQQQVVVLHDQVVNRRSG